MTVLMELMEKRERFSRREHRRYQVHRVLNLVRSGALLVFGFWCYTMRTQIQALVTDLLTQ